MMVQIPGQTIWFRADQLLFMRVYPEHPVWVLSLGIEGWDEPLYLQYETAAAADAIAQVLVKATAR